MLKLATILQNPGEPEIQTRYHNPQDLLEMGYNGLVIYETTALSGVDRADHIVDSQMRRWVVCQLGRVQRRIQQARDAGLAVYICYDVLSLLRDTVGPAASKFTCKHRPATVCPGSQMALEQSGAALRQLIEQLPFVDGVVIRFGDSDASRLPYLVGNDIYQPRCARCEGLDAAQRVCRVVDHFFGLVVGQLGKRLIARAWNIRPGGMHDSVRLCRQVIQQWEGSPDQADGETGGFVWSFKFTEADFRRYQRWNPVSLVAGGRWPIIYELQCQREFEGKGGVPNWQVPLWRDGAPECNPADRGGLAQVATKVRLAGLWAWVRGGGWGGPFVDHEAWIDANVFAVPALADDPKTDKDALAQAWVSRRVLADDQPAAEAIKEILAQSTQVVLNGFYVGPCQFAQPNANHPWIQDDLIDVQAIWQIVQRLNDQKLDQLVSQKQDAAEQVASGRANLQRLLNEKNRAAVEPLINTLLYTESLLAALRDLWTGLVAYRRYLVGHDSATGQACRQRLLAAGSWWNHHTQRHGALPGAATAFREVEFWELTQQILVEVG